MNTTLAMAVAAGLVLAAVLLTIGFFFLRKKVGQERLGIRTEAERALADARKQADSRLREADIEAKE